MTAALAFENVDILFTGLQGRKREAAIKAALASLDQGRSRAEIQTASGVVVGVVTKKVVQVLRDAARANQTNVVVAREIRHLQLAPIRKRVTAVASEHEVLLEQLAVLQTRHPGAASSEREVGFTAAYHLHCSVRGRVGHAHMDAGVRGAEADNGRREPVRRQRRQGRHEHTPLAHGGVVAKVLVDLIQLHHYPTRGFDEPLAFGREAHAPPVAVHQAHVDLLLQLGDHLAERRLRHMATLRRQ